MFEKRRSATGWLGCQGLLLAMVLLMLLSALSGCGSGQSDVGQTNGNSVPVNLNILMPQESAAASTSGSRFWATVQSWLPSVTSAWAQALTPQLVALTVEVTGPGLDPPITSREGLSDPRSGQTVTFTLDVPVGPNRVFTVSGLNGSGRAILQGQSTPIVLTPGQPTTVDITLVDITITITTPSLPSGTVGVAYSEPVQATGGTGALTWTINAGALPPPLTINSSTGVISGTPSTAGTFNFTVRATDTTSLFDAQPLSITIAHSPIPPNITTTTLPGGTVNAAYSQPVRATGGTGALTWTISAGALPPPLTLNPTTGVISGIPSTAGTFNFTVRATDTLLLFDTQSLSIIINAPPLALTITTTTLPTATVTHDYRARLAASGGTPPYTWSIDCQSSCPPPASGLSLSSSGAITGTPTTAGTFLETYRVRDSIGATVTKELTLSVNPPALTIDTTSLPDGRFDGRYFATLSASGGTPPYTWSIIAGVLPAGLSLQTDSSSGNFNSLITGVPTACRNQTTYSQTYRVVDSTETAVTKDLTIFISPCIE